MTLTWQEVRELNDVARRLKYLIKKAGFEVPAFVDLVIVKSGEHSDPPTVEVDLSGG